MNNPESYHALVLGDLHYNRPGCQGGEPENESQKRWRKLSLDMWSGKSRSLLKDAAGRLERGDFPLVLQTGDLIQGDCIDSARQSGMFRDAIQTVKQYTGAERRFLPVVGNHDLLLQDSASRTPGYDGQGRCVRPFSGEYEAVRDVLMPFIAEEAGLETVPEDANYAVRQGPDLFLFVDPFRAGMKEFIERTLDAVPDTRYVFAVSHLALLPCDPDRALVRWLMPDPAETAALLEKKTVFFSFDLDSYRKQRDFYFNYEDYVPGPVAATFSDLLAAIGAPSDPKRRETFLAFNFDYRDCGSTERVLRTIVKSQKNN